MSYLYKPCRLVKNSLKWCKNSAAPPPEPPQWCGEAGKAAGGKNLGLGKMKKGENGFPLSNLNLIIDNHHLQCVSYLYTNPVDWFKKLSQMV